MHKKQGHVNHSLTSHPHIHHTSQKLPNRKQPNNFKALYHLSMKRKNKMVDELIMRNTDPAHPYEKTKAEISKCIDDSLDNPEDMIDRKQEDQSHRRGFKKWSHSRSQSCPFINPSMPLKEEPKQEKQPYVYNRVLIENESKRTLKKSSTLHRKTKNHQKQKSSIGNISQVSQQSNTVIVHSLPIQHLSSMLYSRNQDRDRQKEKEHNKNFKKSSQNSSRISHHIFSIHTQLYFQTRLQQQMKVYDLNQELKKLNIETQHAKIKQDVLEKLATNFGRFEINCQEEESLLIH